MLEYKKKSPHLPLATPHLLFEPYCLHQTPRYRSCHRWLLSWSTSLLAVDLPPPWRPSLWRCYAAVRQLQFQSCWWSVGTDQGCSRCRGGPSPGHHWCKTLCNAFSLQFRQDMFFCFFFNSSINHLKKLRSAVFLKKKVLKMSRGDHLSWWSFYRAVVSATS